MVKRWFVVGLILLLMSLLAVGCGIPQEEHDAVVAERDAAKSQVASLQSDLAEAESQIDTLESDLDSAQSRISSLQSEFDETKSSLTAVQQKIATLQGDYEDVSTELAEIKKVYPPGDFKSVTELETWIANHVQPSAIHLDGDFRSALKIQSQGLEDGYLISVVFDEDDRDPTGGWIFCAVLVNGGLYMWLPFETEVYSRADDFTR